jgi:hypothetical protein
LDHDRLCVRGAVGVGLHSGFPGRLLHADELGHELQDRGCLVLGIAAFVQLRRLLRRETETIEVCMPGDMIEIVGIGPATVNRSDGGTDRARDARA